MPSILKGVKIPQQGKSFPPLWEGPNGKGRNGGITSSLLSRYLCCEERARLLMIHGLKPPDQFNHRLEYGNMWHVCEENYHHGKPDGRRTHSSDTWDTALERYADHLAMRYPLSREDIDHWYNVCLVQFPIYLTYWGKHPETATVQTVMREQVFDVQYLLPSGRTVRLRGKWDGVDRIDGGSYLLENKTKGDIDAAKIRRQLSFDLQVMCYAVSFQVFYKEDTLKGIRYNVIRRPLSGGKFSITRHKPKRGDPDGESEDEFFARLSGIIRENLEHFFIRWRVELQSYDLQKFRHQTLDPLLENLYDDWEWWDDCYRSHGDVFNDGWRGKDYPNHHCRHYRMPYGVWNPLSEDKPTELDEYLATGSTLGLQRANTLFPELEQEDMCTTSTADKGK